MTPALIGRKVGMARIYDEKCAVVPVTVVQAGRWSVTEVRTLGSDGYNPVQLGYEAVKAKYTTMPLIGHAAKPRVGPKQAFREINLKAATDKKIGDNDTAEIFNDV